MKRSHRQLTIYLSKAWNLEWNLPFCFIRSAIKICCCWRYWILGSSHCV